MANAKAKSADRIVEAFIAHANASWMRTVTEVRTEEPRTDHTVEVIAGFEVAVDKGRLDADTAKVYASQVRSVYMVPTNNFLDIVGQTGGAISATMRLIAAWKRGAGIGSKAGRKAGQGSGKTTKPEVDDAAAESATVPNNDKAWIDFLRQIQAQVPSRKDWTAEDIRAVQDMTGTMIALLKRNSK